MMVWFGLTWVVFVKAVGNTWCYFSLGAHLCKHWFGNIYIYMYIHNMYVSVWCNQSTTMHIRLLWLVAIEQMVHLT